jgi:aromatic ring-cleaving dioxygenase
VAGQQQIPRWRVRAIDTSALPVERVAATLVEWIEEERALVRSGAHPLTGRDAYDIDDE